MTEGNVGIIGGRDRKESASGEPKSPWKTSIAAPVVVEADSESWPALSLGQQRVKSNGSVGSNSAQLPASSSSVELDDSGPSATILAQPTAERQKFHGRGNARSNRRLNSSNQNKNGMKQRSNGMPRYPVIPLYYPPILNPYFHAVAPFPPGPDPEYTYPLYSGLYGGDHPQNFMPSVSAGFQSTVRPEFSAHDPAYTGTMASSKEHGGLVATPWHNQRPPAVPIDYLQQNTGHRHFARPAFFAPVGVAPGAPAVYYSPAPHSGAFRVPYLPYPDPYTMSPGVHMPTLPTDDLRAKIIQQIEYYFCDENLSRDSHLRSLMDVEGWVHISHIAEFNRVKKMNVGVPFILDALQASETVEIQGEKLRRRGEWSKWIQAPLITKPSSLAGSTLKIDDSGENRVDGSVGTAGFPVDPMSVNGDALLKSSSTDLEQMRPEVHSNQKTDALLTNQGSNVELDKPKTKYISSQHITEPIPSEISGSDSMKSINPENCEDFSMHEVTVSRVHAGLAHKFSRTFLHQKDLYTDQNNSRHFDYSNKKRVDKAEDNTTFSDQAVENFTVVAQDRHLTEADDDESKFRYAKDTSSYCSNSPDYDEKKSDSPSVRKNTTTKMYKQRPDHDNFRAHESSLNSPGIVFGSSPADAARFSFESAPSSRNTDSNGVCHDVNGDYDQKVPKKKPPKLPDGSLGEEHHSTEHINHSKGKNSASRDGNP